MSLQRKAKSRAAETRSIKREAKRAANPRQNKYPVTSEAHRPGK